MINGGVGGRKGQATSDEVARIPPCDIALQESEAILEMLTLYLHGAGDIENDPLIWHAENRDFVDLCNGTEAARLITGLRGLTQKGWPINLNLRPTTLEGNTLNAPLIAWTRRLLSWRPTPVDQI